MTEWPPFSSDAFLDVLRDVYFPRARKAVVACEGVRVRTLVSGKTTAVSGFWQFPFYLEPLPAGKGGEALPAPYLADVVVALTAAGEPGPPGTVPAPFVRWDGFESWDQFIASRVTPPGAGSPGSALRDARRLERDHGPLDFQASDPDPSAPATIMRWKSEQYRRSGAIDRFANPQLGAFYEEMQARGLLQASTLRAGGTLVAGHLGNHLQGRMLYRLPSYDPSYGRYSPGHVLLLRLLRESFESGDREFDFLGGGEPYKYTYATHVRWLKTLGSEPWLTRTRRVARQKAGRALRGRKGYTAYKRIAWKAAQATRKALPARHRS